MIGEGARLLVFGPASCGELDYTRRPRRSLHAGMLVLLDRNLDAAALIGQLAATGADLLVRLRSNRKLRNRLPGTEIVHARRPGLRARSPADITQEV